MSASKQGASTCPCSTAIQVIRAVRGDERLRELPIIAVSVGGSTARQGALAAGADFFLDEPMRLKEILATMQRLMDLQRG